MVSVLPPSIAGTTRAGVYTRVSTLPQAEHGYGLESQMKDCLRLADELGAEVVQTYEDQDSGTLWELPGLNALLDDAHHGKLDAVIVYDPDRLSRRMAKYLVLEEELKKAGVRLQFVTIRGGDTPEDRAMQHMKAVFAELDHERIVLRMMRGKRTKAEKGLVVGTGIAPYGYRYIRNEKGRQCGLEVDPSTAPVVERIFRDAAHLSLVRIAALLNADGIRTYHRSARGWAQPSLHSLLNNPVYVGQAPYGRRGGKEKKPQAPSTWLYSTVPAIVDQPTWDAAQAGLKARNALREGRKDTTRDAYLLRGAVTCAHCGGALFCDVVGAHPRYVRYYMCGRHKGIYARRLEQERCPLSNVPAPALDRLAWDEVVATLLDPDRLAEGLVAAQAEHAQANGRRLGRLTTLDQEVQRYRARLSRILDEELDAPSGSESARLLREKRAQIEDTLVRLQAERGNLMSEPTSGLSPSQALELERFASEVRDGIAHATPADQRRVLQLLQVHATVRLDPEHGVKLARANRFTIEWSAVIKLRSSERELCNIKTVFISAGSGTTPTSAKVAGE